MRNIIQKLVEWHGYIGNLLIALCLSFFVIAVVGLASGLTKCDSEDHVIRSNYFLNEPAPIHDENYSLTVNSVYTTYATQILNKELDHQNVDGYLICLEVTLSQYEGSNLKKHRLDENDFKLKNHTGVYLPLNDIMGALGWDAIDVHIDEEGGGHVMSSIDFSTRNCLKDYNFIDQYIEPGKVMNFVITFEMATEIIVESNITVLEGDFYNSSYDYRKGTDIVLLLRPTPLESNI